MTRRGDSVAPSPTTVLAVGRLADNPYLPAFFPDATILRRLGWRGRPDAVCVLAGDPATGAARQVAASRGARLMVVEEGPIRSAGAPTSGAPSVSLMVDPGRRLEALLADLSWATPDLKARAATLMRIMEQAALSRCNAGRDPTPELEGAGERALVLVLDRSGEEEAFGAPPPPPGAYGELVRLARSEHPDACLILLRPLPSGSLTADEIALVDRVVEGDVDAAPLIDRATVVYAAGGYLALEALLRGRPVVCAGEPAFGSLGLTRDLALRPDRPTIDRQTLFAALYLQLPTYADPHGGAPCSAEAAIERVAAFRRHARRVAGDWIGLNIAPAKDRVLADFLEGPCSTFRARSASWSSSPTTSRLAVWSSAANRRTRAAEAARPGSIVRIEDGFLRSVGLGAAFHEAGSIVLDRRGMHYDHRGRSELDDLIDQARGDTALLERARGLAARIVELGLTKYNLDQGAGPPLSTPAGRRVVLVPGQVADDASVLTGGGGMTASDLLRRVRAAEPDAHIVFRPHPDVLAGLRPGERITAGDSEADQIADGGDIIDWIDRADAVHVLTSLAGFEALLRNKPVTAHGWPFYAGRGLTADRGLGPAPRREAASLEALVAGALILYPLYVHPVSRLPCSPELFVSSLAEQRGARGDAASGGRYARVLRQMLGRRPARTY